MATKSSTTSLSVSWPKIWQTAIAGIIVLFCTLSINLGSRAVDTLVRIESTMATVINEQRHLREQAHGGHMRDERQDRDIHGLWVGQTEIKARVTNLEGLR